MSNDDVKMPVLVLKNVRRSFVQGNSIIDVLKGIDLSILKGEMVALVGPSGAGKSTMLHVTGLLENPNEGDVYLNGTPCANMNDAMRTKMRRDYLGFIYQSHNLLPEFNALENVMLPQMIAGVKKKEAKDYAVFLLEKMGLADRLKHRPAQLSGGEAQRVAIARALANKPHILLADEPTGNLDPITSETVFSFLLKIVRETGLSALIATHNLDLAERMDRKITIKDGKLEELDTLGMSGRIAFKQRFVDV
ncbi:MAG: ABC transporter ATP-binding protein [Alphaproteobacteria bacterium]|nr:ABC transporter ATP-binding protein [Alphaproteobacteria bacterium]